MSAVFRPFTKVVESVFDAVGDVVETVGDVVETVADKVGDTVQAIINDPLPVLLSIAGQAVGIPAPLTMATITAARGGDLEDIALSAGTAYLAPQVANAISPTISSSFIDAGMNETASQVASSSLSRGLINGTISEVRGGSFEDGFAGGFTGGMVSGGVREVGDYIKDNVAINDQFKTVASYWDNTHKEDEPIDTTATGAGIPNEVVDQVTVSGYGGSNTVDGAGQPISALGSTATSDISVMPETQLANAPQGETAANFAEMDNNKIPFSSTPSLAGDFGDLYKDLLESKGALSTMAEATTESPEGGLNAVAQSSPASPEAKMASSTGLKATDFTKPLVATVGNLLTQAMIQPNRPVPRSPMPRPVGGLQMAGAITDPRKYAPPPLRMDIANLIPMQKATPIAPPKTLPSTARLSPVNNIAGLTSLVNKTG